MAEWSAPVDRWVRRATDREDKVLGPAVRLLADELWSLADSPKKRGEGHAFIYGRWTEIDRIAEDFGCDPRTIGSQFSVLRAAGLAKRGRGPDRDGRDVRGIWLADVPNTGRFDPVKKTAKDPGKRTKPSGADAQTIRSHRTKPSGGECAKDPVTPDKTIRSPVLKEDPIKPYHSPTAPTGPPAESQPGLFGETEAPKRDPIAELRELHESLSIAAFTHHGLEAKNGRVLGKLPAPSTKQGREITSRMRDAIKTHGFETCEAMIRWRAAEWRTDRQQLARPPSQAWSPKAVAFVVGKLDADLQPGGGGPRGRRPTGGSGHGAVDRWANYSEET